MQHETKDMWLCRHCNTQVASEQAKCPKCGASRPEELDDEANGEVITISEVNNTEPKPKAKYIFREAVLVNAADILLILGIFCSIAALIAPAFIKHNTENPTTLSIVIGVAIFCISLITWALFRSIAEISRLLRQQNDKI